MPHSSAPQRSLAARATPARTLFVAALTVLAPLACSPGDGAVGDTASANAAAATAAGAEACSASATIAAEGIGPARLGSSAEELARQCGARDTTFTVGEGITERGYVVSIAGSSLVALADGDSVRRLIVREPGLTTAGGIGVGSTVADVRRAYPDACALVGEGLIVVAADSLPGVSFATSADFGQFATGGSPRIEALPDSARIATVWVHGVPRPCSEVR